jgi:hypothetical protein
MTKNKIIISSTNSRLLDNIKISSHNHFNNIDWYTINIDEIFKSTPGELYCFSSEPLCKNE